MSPSWYSPTNRYVRFPPLQPTLLSRSFPLKQDVQGALSPAEISDKLGLAGGEKGREWSVRGSCAIKGEGLEEGLDWLVNTISK